MVIFCRPCATGTTAPPIAQFHPDLSARSRQMDEQQDDYGEDETAAWYLTKAMAANSLQNSSSTITPSSKVMWSILKGGQTERWEYPLKVTSEHTNQNHVEVHTWCPLAPCLIISSSQAKVWVWSLGYGESSTWDLQPPNTHTRTHECRAITKTQQLIWATAVNHMYYYLKLLLHCVPLHISWIWTDFHNKTSWCCNQ